MLSEELIKLGKQVFPNTEIILSTWDFGNFIDGEWDAFAKKVSSSKLEKIDYLLCSSHDGLPEYINKYGSPCDLSVITFPEISMKGIQPRGGFGANPRPRYLENYFGKITEKIVGTLPYSEGIFEDLSLKY